MAQRKSAPKPKIVKAEEEEEKDLEIEPEEEPVPKKKVASKKRQSSPVKKEEEPAPAPLKKKKASKKAAAAAPKKEASSSSSSSSSSEEEEEEAPVAAPAAADAPKEKKKRGPVKISNKNVPKGDRLDTVTPFKFTSSSKTPGKARTGESAKRESRYLQKTNGRLLRPAQVKRLFKASCESARRVIEKVFFKYVCVCGFDSPLFKKRKRLRKLRVSGQEESQCRQI
jgi:hypothetical protein